MKRGQDWLLASGLALTALGALGTFGIAAGTFGTVALADDGGLMQRMMGHEAFATMVAHMRTVLGDAQANEMLASCEKMMASADMGGMMSGTHEMSRMHLKSGMHHMMGH